jgi:hypothetical protein
MRPSRDVLVIVRVSVAELPSGVSYLTFARHQGNIIRKLQGKPEGQERRQQKGPEAGCAARSRERRRRARPVVAPTPPVPAARHDQHERSEKFQQHQHCGERRLLVLR